MKSKDTEELIRETELNQARSKPNPVDRPVTKNCSYHCAPL